MSEDHYMKKTLYIVSRPPVPEDLLLLPSVSQSKGGASVVFIQDGVTHQKPLVSRTFVLGDDVKSRNVISPFPTVSYQELLGMIFEADNVAVV